MAKLFNLKIVSPEKVVYSGMVSSLTLPCELGYLGVLADHSPLIANVKTGKITVKHDPDKLITFQYHGTGFLEVLKNNVTVILNQPLSV